MEWPTSANHTPLPGTSLSVLLDCRNSNPLQLADLLGCQVLLPVSHREFAVPFDPLIENDIRDGFDTLTRCGRSMGWLSPLASDSISIFVCIVPDFTVPEDSFRSLSTIYDSMKTMREVSASTAAILVPPTIGVRSESLRKAVLDHLVEHHRVAAGQVASPTDLTFVLPSSPAERDRLLTKKCQICFERRPSASAFVRAPCGHSMCAPCNAQIRLTENPLCPFCRHAL